MLTFTSELFFQLINIILLISLLILGYKLICYISKFLCGLGKWFTIIKKVSKYEY